MWWWRAFTIWRHCAEEGSALLDRVASPVALPFASFPLICSPIKVAPSGGMRIAQAPADERASPRLCSCSYNAKGEGVEMMVWASGSQTSVGYRSLEEPVHMQILYLQRLILTLRLGLKNHFVNKPQVVGSDIGGQWTTFCKRHFNSPSSCQPRRCRNRWQLGKALELDDIGQLGGRIWLHLLGWISNIRIQRRD